MVRKRVITGFMLLLFLGAILSLIQFFNFGGLLGFVVFEQGGETGFENGTFVNTVFNGSDIVLIGDNLTGVYTSEIFNAGNSALWNNVSLIRGVGSLEDLLLVDAQSDLYISKDAGFSWTLLVNDYNGAIVNGANFMTKNDSNVLYILHRQDLWQSVDFGKSWSLINDDYNFGENNNGFVIEISSDGTIVIIEGGQDVWRSNDFGFSFTKVNETDFNGGNGNVRGMAVDSGDVFYAVDTSADVWRSNDFGESWILIRDDYNEGNNNNANDMSVNSTDALFIVHGQDLWTSLDNGFNWTLVNDDFNPSDSGTGRRMFIDSNDDIYIVDASEDVYMSNDSGATFSLLTSNYNLANGNVFGIIGGVKNSNLTYQFRNCSSSDCSDGIFVGPDGTNATSFSLAESVIDLRSRYFQYRMFFERDSSDVSLYLTNVTIDYTLLASAPIVDIFMPQNGASFGDNESLKLNFTVVNATSPLDSCWYSLDYGISNISLAQCANITFDVPGDGSYSLGLWSNESNSNLVGFDFVNFSVVIGAPTIVMNSPDEGIYQRTLEVAFNYTATDLNLDSCELWGDFTGEFALNQTDTSVISGSSSVFGLNLSDGIYTWNIYCNDTTGNGAFNGNRSFGVDSIWPEFSIIEPVGSYSSVSGIAFNITYNDSSPVNCVYNVSFLATGNPVIDDTLVSECNYSNFDVDTESNYVLYLKINDSAGNQNVSSSQFVVDVPSGGTGGGGGGGGGGGSSSTPEAEEDLEIFGVEIFDLENLKMGAGESEIVSFGVTNTGTRFLNDCRVTAIGGIREWIDGKQVESLSPGQNVDFVFTVNVPVLTISGQYEGDIIVVCSEYSSGSDFVIDVESPELSVLIQNTRRDGSRLVVDFIIEDFAQRDRQVGLLYELVNDNGVSVLEGDELVEVVSGERRSYSIDFELPKDSFGNFELRFEVASGSETITVTQDVFLETGGAALTGFAVLSEENRQTLFVVGGIVIGFGVLFFVFRFLRMHFDKTHVSNEEKRRHYIRLDLKEARSVKAKKKVKR